MPRKHVKKHRKTVGAAPGTLVHLGERKIETVRLRVIDYDAETLQERDLPAGEASRCCPLRETPTVSWINLDGLHQVEVIEALGGCYGLHPLVLEDILHTDQRPKLEAYEEYLFLVLKMLHFDEETAEVRTEQVGLILGPRHVISFQEKEGDVFEPVRERIRHGKGRIRRMGADYLAYALLDAVVDSYFVLLEKIGDRIELLEEELVASPSPDILHRIHNLKREMILLRRSVWPLREVISALQREESALVRPETDVFLRDLYDHTIQVVDTVETYRDLVAGLLDLHLSSVSNRMNEVMKVLTLTATIFIPLTFMAGIYGMNFDFMPELHWRWSYPLLWLAMVGVAAGMYLFFRRRKWL